MVGGLAYRSVLPFRMLRKKSSAASRLCISRIQAGFLQDANDGMADSVGA